MVVSENLLNKCLDDIISKKNIFSTVLRVESGDGSFAWVGSRGEMQPDSKYFIASVTKLYVTAVVMSLIEEGKLSLDEKISKHLPGQLMEGLHVLKGVDYSDEITICHLISNTSGLPDYFTHKEDGKPSGAYLLLQGRDDAWGLDKTIDSMKKMTPKFAPGKKGKAAYSDTNYQLLGKIIETVTGEDIGDVFQKYIFDKLGLFSTYAFNDIADKEPAPLYYKDRQLWLPNYMMSITSEGGIVSTADEVMAFLKAFFSGRFFPKEKIEGLKKWNLLLPPPGLFYFGIGLEKTPTPRIVSLRKPINEIIGFWGQTSSFAWYNPDADLYFTGTANQIDGTGHRAAMKAIIRPVRKLLHTISFGARFSQFLPKNGAKTAASYHAKKLVQQG
ncbi:MAG: beta-lactamase family protein, partial [Defluviitaleaceae bacterium]|nr:beta-lactamase family protein [Defluviitaleaceae bacterium]